MTDWIDEQDDDGPEFNVDPDAPDDGVFEPTFGLGITQTALDEIVLSELNKDAALGEIGVAMTELRQLHALHGDTNPAVASTCQSVVSGLAAFGLYLKTQPTEAYLALTAALPPVEAIEQYDLMDAALPERRRITSELVDEIRKEEENIETDVNLARDLHAAGWSYDDIKAVLAVDDKIRLAKLHELGRRYLDNQK